MKTVTQVVTFQKNQYTVFSKETYKVSSIHDAILNRLAAVNVELQLQLLALATFALQSLAFLGRHLGFLAALGLRPLCWGFGLKQRKSMVETLITSKLPAGWLIIISKWVMSLSALPLPL